MINKGKFKSENYVIAYNVQVMTEQCEKKGKKSIDLYTLLNKILSDLGEKEITDSELSLSPKQSKLLVRANNEAQRKGFSSKWPVKSVF